MWHRQRRRVQPLSLSAIVTKLILNYTRREAHLHPIVDDWIAERAIIASNELQEGNFFSCVRLADIHSFHGGVHATIIHGALDLTILGRLLPDMRPHCTGIPKSPPPAWTWDFAVQGSPALVTSTSDIWWLRLETCSNLFTWGPPGTGGYWSTYCEWLSMHYTGMLSCICIHKFSR